MSTGTMVTKKIRTEYMKRFRDPKWETFSKCYEDCVKYRLSRRVMEHSHRPWLWDGWDNRSDSSGCSTPRLSSNKVAPLSLPPPASSETNPRGSGAGPEGEEPEEVAVVDAQAAGEQAPPPPSLEAAENILFSVSVVDSSLDDAAALLARCPPSEDAETDTGPAETGSSDGEPGNPAAGRRHRRRSPQSQPGRTSSARKPPRAKSQPAISSKEVQRTQRHPEVSGTFRGTSRRLYFYLSSF